MLTNPRTRATVCLLLPLLACFSNAREDYRGARRDCRDVRDARLDVCDGVGEGPYQPTFGGAFAGRFVDTAAEDGTPVEITDDGYAQDLDGNVFYCGEISENFELFEGDDPEVPELVDIEGSWKHGRGGCLQTRDFTPLEPDVEENKYYLPGVGLILEIDPEEDVRVELKEYGNVAP